MNLVDLCVTDTSFIITNGGLISSLTPDNVLATHAQLIDKMAKPTWLSFIQIIIVTSIISDFLATSPDLVHLRAALESQLMDVIMKTSFYTDNSVADLYLNLEDELHTYAQMISFNKSWIGKLFHLFYIWFNKLS